jgi:transcriptional regulator GlxA family with amidase domain
VFKSKNPSLNTDGIYQIPRNSSPQIVRAVLFIHRNFCDTKLTTLRVAIHVGMDEDDFYNLFRKEMKITPMKFLTRVRVYKSKSYLKEPELSVYEVASQSGFRNYDSFRMHFQRREGITPVKYRRKNIYKNILDTKEKKEDAKERYSFTEE